MVDANTTGETHENQARVGGRCCSRRRYDRAILICQGATPPELQPGSE